MIEVADSSIRLLTLDERVDGVMTPHYGISLDGHSLVRVKAASYELGLSYGRFDPLAGEPPVSSSLSATSETGLYLVQFHTQPLEMFSRQITELGGHVRHYVAQYAYLVDMAPAVRDQVAELPYVRWIGAYHPAYRLDLDLPLTLLGSSPASVQAAGCRANSPQLDHVTALLAFAGGKVANLSALKSCSLTCPSSNSKSSRCRSRRSW